MYYYKLNITKCSNFNEETHTTLRNIVEDYSISYFYRKKIDMLNFKYNVFFKYCNQKYTLKFPGNILELTYQDNVKDIYTFGFTFDNTDFFIEVILFTNSKQIVNILSVDEFSDITEKAEIINLEIKPEE